jgi:hypothetical protein
MPVRYGNSLSELRLADSIHALSARLQISNIGPKPNTACTFPAHPPRCPLYPRMSALPPKADIARQFENVR